MGGLLPTDIDDPRNQGLLGTALAMLAASGPSPQRRTFGQILGASGLQGMQRYDQARVLKQRDEELARRNRLVDMQISQAEQEQAAQQQLTNLLRDPSFLTKQEKVYSASDAGPDMQVQQVPLTPREQAMKFVQTGNPMLARAGLQAMMNQKAEPEFMVVGNSVFYPKTREFISSQAEKPTDEWERLSETTPGGQLMQRNKRTGEIKPIGSGPPQQNTIMMQRADDENNGRQGVSDAVLNIRSAFESLDALGGAVKSGQGAVKNAANMAMSTTPGGYIGRVIAPQQQMWRDYINTQRPALINEIRRATGMSARNMDSNRELQFYIAMVGDTGVDIDVNKAALEAIDSKFGTKFGVTSSAEGRTQLEKMRDAAIGKPKAATTEVDLRALSNIPLEAINDLRKNPSLAEQFDAYYGQGMSRAVLGK